MGNLINPIGGRVGILNFWRSTWPIAFNKKLQVFFFQISVQIRMLLQAFLLKTFKLNPNHFVPEVLHGMVLKIISNVWGFLNNNLSIYFKFFDYKASVNMLRSLPSRFYIRKLFFGLRKLIIFKSWAKAHPKILSRRNFLWNFNVKLLNKMRFLSKTKVFRLKLRKFIKKGFASIHKVLYKRMRRWHYNLIVFAKPFLFFLCKFYNFKRCFLFTIVGKSTITAGMIARYMVLKFLQGFKLNFIINTIRRTIRFFFKNRCGYKICLSGRFTRKQIATYRWFKSGSVTLNQRVSGIDYAHDGGASKFGLFGIKIWIFMAGNT